MSEKLKVWYFRRNRYGGTAFISCWRITLV